MGAATAWGVWMHGLCMYTHTNTSRYDIHNYMCLYMYAQTYTQKHTHIHTYMFAITTEGKRPDGWGYSMGRVDEWIMYVYICTQTHTHTYMHIHTCSLS
jgi:hypothetical protein